MLISPSLFVVISISIEIEPQLSSEVNMLFSEKALA